MTDSDRVKRLNNIVDGHYSRSFDYELVKAALERLDGIDAAFARDSEHSYPEAEIVTALACVYPNSGSLVGHICDEHLDKSGRLLGIVRDEAMRIRPMRIRKDA